MQPAAKKQKRSGRTFDPNAPKRPANAFLIFCGLEKDNVRREMQESNTKPEGAEHQNLTKALAAKWRAMNEVDKK
ncbi:hypothetical protein BDK51DRAFT_21377, partial [Blyttiomyces helicus]